ncbi:MAG: hypothetical protein ACPGLY_16775, partial [Rubripirellula sp.]
THAWPQPMPGPNPCLAPTHPNSLTIKGQIKIASKSTSQLGKAVNLVRVCGHKEGQVSRVIVDKFLK